MTDDLDRLYELTMRSPRKKSLEVLMLLAFLFYPMHFYLIEQIWRRNN